MRLLGRLLLIFLLLQGCSDKRPQAVPRPQAWPRLAEMPATYQAAEGLMINDSARIDKGESEGWFDIVYPAYNVRINCTLTSVSTPEELQNVIDNRLERLERNAGGAAGQLIELTSDGGWGCLLMSTPEAVATPVQFLATDSVSRLFSGTAVFSGRELKVDSIAPAVAVIERDLIYMLRNIKDL